MAGPSGHGQRNKAHKSGNKGASARQKHRMIKEAGPRAGAKGGAGSYAGGKQHRLVAAKNLRDAKRAELLDKRRRAAGAPLVVAVLPLSQEVNVSKLWRNLLAACQQPQLSAAPTQQGDDTAAAAGDDDEMMPVDDSALTLMEEESGEGASEVKMCTVAVAGRAKLRLTLLPPISPRNSPLAVVDMAKAAEVVLLAVPGGEGTKLVDAEGEMALTILRALGLPEVALAVQSAPAKSSSGKPGAVNMKERSATRKRAEKAVGAVLAGEHKAYFVDHVADCVQLVRHLAERPAPELPHWRQQRPALMVEQVEYLAGQAGGSQQAAVGELALTGYVRCAGLSVNQLMTVPGIGDFQIDRIEGPSEPQVQQPAGAERRKGATDMEMTSTQPVLLAKADPELQEPLTRENLVEGEDGEQTWPSAAELAEAAMFARRKAKKKVPEGTSEYQAAWLLDDEEDDEDDDDEDDDGMQGSEPGEGVEMEEGEGQGLELAEDEDAATDGMALDDEGEDGSEAGNSKWARLQAEARARREAEGQDAQYPDEVDVPLNQAARVRFQKYRGLKSFRSSPWDAKEWLPQEYAKVFAFENLKRAHKRACAAVARATDGTDPSAVTPGTWVRVVLRAVTPQQAQAVAARVEASTAAAGGSGAQQVQAPVVCFGLMTHEAKLSVVHFSVTKSSGYTQPLASKEELLLVTGLRAFKSRPVFSADTPGDKQKMERWLKPGTPCIASVYAPIAYPPLPLLAFKEDPAGGPPQLAATGSLRSCNPDRVVLKRIVLTGYPVRVHKRRCTVRFMFHDPDDVRWFRPVELYTRSGRRGRITEPLGTHGTLKALFDGPVQQQEVVCMSLYKRVYPKWPANNDLSFA